MDILNEYDNLYATDREIDFDSISLEDIENLPVKGRNTLKEKRVYLNNNVSEAHSKDTNAILVNDKKHETQLKHKSNLELSRTAQTVYDYISNEPVHIDKISNDLNIPVFKVLTALTMLEMKGLVSALQGRKYILK